MPRSDNPRFQIDNPGYSIHCSVPSLSILLFSNITQAGTYIVRPPKTHYSNIISK